MCEVFFLRLILCQIFGREREVFSSCVGFAVNLHYCRKIILLHYIAVKRGTQY